MARFDCSFVMALFVIGSLVGITPGVFAQSASPAAYEARLEEGIWILGLQQWDFSEVATVYQPVRGTYDPKTGEVVWMLELVRDMVPGEVAIHENLVQTAFRPVFLNDDRIALLKDAPVQMSPITGKQGDRVRMTITPMKPEIMHQATLVRVERRTDIGF